MFSNRITWKRASRAGLLLIALSVVMVVSVRLRADTGNCNGAILSLPFSDVPGGGAFFCAIASAYFTGLTNGTTATTFSPTTDVTREQMAAFITRTQDLVLRRSNKRAFMQQWWTPTLPEALRPADLGAASNPIDIVFDGQDLWTANFASDSVSRVRASDGRLLQTWTGIEGARGIIACAGRIFVTSDQGNTPGEIYVIDPEAPAGGVATLFDPNVGVDPLQITFDGTYLWTANWNGGGGGSVSRLRVDNAADSTFAAGFDAPHDILWDGANLWVADRSAADLKRVDRATGAVLESIALAAPPKHLLFDGTNLWITTGTDSIKVVRAVGSLRGTILATLTGNGLNTPAGMAFDGERVLVTNQTGQSVSLFKAADFTPLNFPGLGVGGNPVAACSDGVNFWIVRFSFDDIVRF